jgi:formylglycine-generating enzyme required for sulfatase activity
MKIKIIARLLSVSVIFVTLALFGCRWFYDDNEKPYSPRPPKPKTEPEMTTDTGEITTDTGIELILISAGTFEMGSPADELGRQSNGTPETQHSVKLTKSFYMSKYEVTQELYMTVMGGGG